MPLMFLLLARSCPAIAPQPNTHIDSTDRIAKSIVTISCLLGYHLEDGSKAKSVVCLESGQWTAIPVCKGKVDFDIVF